MYGKERDAFLSQRNTIFYFYRAKNSPAALLDSLEPEYARLSCEEIILIYVDNTG